MDRSIVAAHTLGHAECAVVRTSFPVVVEAEAGKADDATSHESLVVNAPLGAGPAVEDRPAQAGSGYWSPVRGRRRSGGRKRAS
jgi:hypothetical protein